MTSGSFEHGRRAIAALAYAALPIALAGITATSLSGLWERHAAVAEANDLLARLRSRQSASLETAGVPDGLPSGSPFLEGPTVTVATAALMQRVATAATRLDGRISSSQVEIANDQLGDGFVGITANVEIAQKNLQALLYDLEAGMPFLFIDRLDIQSGTAPGEDRSLRVVLTVYGQWQGAQ